MFSWSDLSLWALHALQKGAAVPSSEQPGLCAASRTQQAQPPCAQNWVTCILQISDWEIPTATENVKCIQHGEV